MSSEVVALASGKSVEDVKSVPPTVEMPVESVELSPVIVDDSTSDDV